MHYYLQDWEPQYDFWSYLNFVPGQSLLLTNGSADYPDINADGHFASSSGSQICLDTRSVLTGQFPHINDAPRDNPEIVYVSGNNLMSSRVGQLNDYNGQALSGSWVDINQSGVLIFEKLVGTNYQIFKAYPTEPRIVSTGGTNALVGLPYRYDSDNMAEAYGDPEPNDPRNITPIYWSKVSGPAGFQIDADTGRIGWTPNAPGTYTAVIRAAFMFWGDGSEAGDLQTITVQVAQASTEVVDAVDFRSGNSPDVFTDPTQYFGGGSPRVGVSADGASRLALRVRLIGSATNSFPSLHFSIAGTNQAADGLLCSIAGTTWSADAPASIASVNGTNLAVCLYQSPLDFDAASQPVTIRLFNGTNTIATQTILLRRPPVVLVHDQWSSPDEFGLLFGSLVDVGMDVSFYDYRGTSGGGFSNDFAGLYETVADAIASVRQSSFAASRVDMGGHGAGGVLARLHVQRNWAQGDNYRLGDVHKLITIGTPHNGSWLASVVAGLQTNNASAYASLRSTILSASEASGYFPVVDLSEGVLADEICGSAALAALQSIAVPSHAIATTGGAAPAGDIYSFLQFCLGLTNGGTGVPPVAQNDGFVTIDSAGGGIATNASSVFPNIPHLWQSSDTNISSWVVSLLREPITRSNHFAFFPANAWATNPAPIPGVQTNLGNWLLLTGLTNGQVLFAGQSYAVAAAAADGQRFQSVQFLSPGGSALDIAAPWGFTFSIPTNAVGGWRVIAAARDADGLVAAASVLVTVTNAATLQSIEVDPATVTLTTMAPFQLGVWGLYSDGIVRDITMASTGTKYKSSDRFQISVKTNGVLTVEGGNTVTNIVISITNGVVFTNIVATANLFNLPPTAVMSPNRLSGPCPFDVQFDASASFDSDDGQIAFLWDFGDGTTSSSALSATHRFLVPGDHVVRVVVTDPFGLVSIAQCTVTVEPRLVMIDPSLTLT
jgi:hypothetical protein